VHQPIFQVGHNPRGGNHADDGKRTGDGQALLLTYQVHQHRHREDRAARAEQAEAEADGQRSGSGENHRCHS
jgi:hypothetical protein